MANPKIFISYRRDDSVGHAGRLFDRLAQEFGQANVFRDVDTLAAGEDFVQAVRDRIRHCDVLLVLIGTRWLSATDEDGRWRLADESDLVRTEIATGLQRNLRVIPVLLQGAAMPKAKDLPAELGPLARRNAVDIRDTSFDRDTAQLLQLLGPNWRRSVLRRLQRPAVYAPLSAAVALLAGLWIYPLVAQTPERARIQIVQMGLAYDAGSFVARAKEGDLPATKLFLRAGMAVDAPNRSGETASQWAAAHGHRDVLELLLDHGADPGKPLVWAAGYGKSDILALLLQHRPGPAAVSEAMHNAAGTRYTDIVKTLLDAGAVVDAEPDRDGDRALMEAARVANLATVQLLLERGADVNAQNAYGATALMSCVSSGSSSSDAQQVALRLEIARRLLDKGADPNVRLRSMQTWQPTPLLVAIDERRSPLALLLIERGADVNASTAYQGGDMRQLSALMRAARAGLDEVVAALLAKGAAVQARNENGNDALMEAALGDPRAAVAKALLAGGADANAVNVNQRTALMFLAWQRGRVDIEFVRLLLEHGARIEAADKEGRTALMLAAAEGQTDVARELLRHGARVDAADHEGRSALRIAREANHEEMVKLLSEAAARPAASR